MVKNAQNLQVAATLKNIADGHLQEKNCSEDQQPTRSRCFGPAERMDGFRAGEGLDQESMV